MTTVSLNADLGELPDEDPELYTLVTHANIACGGHAGDEGTMLRAARHALAAGTQLVAHPSYPDREHFGRIHVALAPGRLFATVRDQCAALARAAVAAGAPMPSAVKPHGALYHDAARSPALADAVFDGALAGLAAPALPYVGPPDPVTRAWAERRSIALLCEGFADRRYMPSGELAPRTEPGAVLIDPEAAAAQALALARRGDIDTLCIHGDGPNALAIARAVHDALRNAGLLARKLPLLRAP